jgi:hypothetical protein
MRNAVVVLLVTLVAGIVQAQEVNIGPSQASIAGRMASKMKTSLEPLDVTTTIRCEHSLMLCREEVAMLWVTDEGSFDVGAHQKTPFLGRAPSWIRGRRVGPRCLARLYSSTHSLG